MTPTDTSEKGLEARTTNIRIVDVLAQNAREIPVPRGNDVTFSSDGNRIYYLVPERKPGFFGKVKEGENFNRRNT